MPGKKHELSTVNCQLSTQKKLPLIESLYTIQGEGFHSGKAAFFIRLGGCDVGCHWCDVKESWDASEYPLVSVNEIAREAKKTGCKISVITGGEPLMYNLDRLCSLLKENGIRTHLETSGTHPLTGQWDWICFSPKKFKKPLDLFYDISDELKIIVCNASDFSWAETQLARMSEIVKHYLQPEWSRSGKVLPLIIDYVKKNPHWEISLQIHKFMNIP